MPTRSVDVRLIRRAFDLLAPPDASPKQYLRWKALARQIGLGEHWIRKRYQDRDRSEMELTSIERIRLALQSRYRSAPDEIVKHLVDVLTHAEDSSRPASLDIRAQPDASEFLRLRVVNVGFIRSSSANYCHRLEAGIRFGMLDGLQATHLINDESVDLTRGPNATALKKIHELLSRFDTNPSYVDRTYVVPLGTVAATAMRSALQEDRTLRERLGKDLRIIFAGVTDPASTGLLDFGRDYIGGMYAGNTFADRLQFISEAFPGRRVAFLCDLSLPQDRIARDHVLQCQSPHVKVVTVDKSHPTRLSADTCRCLVTGYTVINWHIHEFAHQNPHTAFIGVNTSDLGFGAVLSTGNDDLRFGITCARRLIVPDCRNEIDLRDVELLRPDPVYGLNQKACNLHGLVARMTARKKCRVIVE